MIFNSIKYAGAAYLIYLGLKLFFQKNIDFTQLQNRLMPNGISSRRIFFQALGVALSNPKAIIFLTALFPQFLNIHAPLIPQFSLLISILMAFSFCFLMSYALLAHKAKIWLIKPSRVKVFNRVSGSVFIGLGILLVSSSKR